MNRGTWTMVVILLLCGGLALWAVTERVEFRYHWPTAEQVSYTRGVKDAMSAMAYMMRRGMGPKEQATAMEKVADMEDQVLWMMLRERSEPLMSGAVRGIVLGEYHEALRSR